MIRPPSCVIPTSHSRRVYRTSMTTHAKRKAGYVSSIHDEQGQLDCTVFSGKNVLWTLTSTSEGRRTTSTQYK